METEKKALIAMSGGVDSSAAALLMQQEGYECIGVTMKLHDEDAAEEEPCAGQRTCCTLSDVEDARSVAFRLGMRYYVFNFTDAFGREVIDRFVRAYEKGCTPNPCVDCNRYMKFEALYHRARELGCRYVVTGHYARIRYDEGRGRWQLLRGRDRAKDQSYVLCFMTQDQLAHTRFPLGDQTDKEEVRLLAQKHGLVNARKRDSQDICFVPDGDYAAFIERRTGKEYPPGDFVDKDGNVLGRHKGIIRYTVGQRRGLGLALPAPLYVRSKDMNMNTVTLVPDSDLYQTDLRAGDMNWISIDPPKSGDKIPVLGMIRYRAKEEAGLLTVLEDGTVHVRFENPVRAITPGQTLCLYDPEDPETVIGGGVIL